MTMANSGLRVNSPKRKLVALKIDPAHDAEDVFTPNTFLYSTRSKEFRTISVDVILAQIAAATTTQMS